jgi:ATP-GRASP peptide maturase of grasp-with-spasm system
MILIISDENDASTHNVIDWLLHYKVPFFRINETSTIRVENISIENNKVDFLFTVFSPYRKSPIQIKGSDIKGYWYRRGFFYLKTPCFFDAEGDNSFICSKLNEFNQEENYKIIDFFHKYFTRIPSLGCFNDNLTINKVYNLYVAQKLQILVPKSAIARQKADVESFLLKCPKSILKGIDRNGFSIGKSISIGNLATLFDSKKMKDVLNDTFNYSFIQEYIEKRADIRIFFIDNKIFGTAIFSQNDEKTKVDFRNYNDEKPNRIQPFQLPLNEEKKLTKLMNVLNYKTGSIDYVLNKERKLYFLEINPIGQYAFISNKCNLYLDKVIADYFTRIYYGKN